MSSAPSTKRHTIRQLTRRVKRLDGDIEKLQSADIKTFKQLQKLKAQQMRAAHAGTAPAYAPSTMLLKSLEAIPTALARRLIVIPTYAIALLLSHTALPEDVFSQLFNAATGPHFIGAESEEYVHLFSRPLSPKQRVALATCVATNEHQRTLAGALRYNNFSPEEITALPVTTIGYSLGADLVARYHDVPAVLRFLLPRVPAPLAYITSLKSPPEVVSDTEILGLVSSVLLNLTHVRADLVTSFHDLLELRPHLISEILSLSRTSPHVPLEFVLALSLSTHAASPCILKELRTKSASNEEVAHALASNPFIPTRVRHHLPGLPRKTKRELRLQHPHTISTDLTKLDHYQDITTAMFWALLGDSSDHAERSYAQPWACLHLAENPNLSDLHIQEISGQLSRWSSIRHLGSVRVASSLDNLTRPSNSTDTNVVLAMARVTAIHPMLHPGHRNASLVLDCPLGQLVEVLCDEPAPQYDCTTLDQLLEGAPENWVQFLRMIDTAPTAATIADVARTACRARRALVAN